MKMKNETLKSIKIQGSIFSQFDDIHPTAKNIMSIIEEFKEFDFIPTVVQEIDNLGVVRKRLDITTTDELWEIEFRTQRINIIYLNEKLEDDKDFDTKYHIEKMISFMNIILDIYERNFFRISLVTLYRYEFSKTKSLEGFNTNVYKLNEFIEESDKPDTWKHYTVNRRYLNVEGNDHSINQIIELYGSTIQENNQSDSRGVFQFKIDINTHQSNIEYRYDKGFIKPFYDHASRLESELKNKILNIGE